MTRKKIRFDIREGIENHIPSFLELLGTSKISWKDINKSVNKFINKVAQEIEETGQIIEREASFYSIIVSKFKGDAKGDAQFDFYNQLFNDLKNILNHQEREKIKDILRSVLLQPNKDYLHFIGELSVLYFYKINGPFELLNVEEKITNTRNTSADFLFLNKENNDQFLIEVVNIHLESKTLSELENLEQILSSKLEEKKKETILNKTIHIVIQPFIWVSGFDQIKKVSDYYTLDIDLPTKTILPLAYISLRDEEGRYYHRINFINQIINDYDT